MDGDPLGRRSDGLVAAGLAAALGGVWAWRDRANLSALRLPDTDDVMRLQQIRDWLAGQGWFDLAQHRLGAGLEMHWSRVADIVPGALIAGGTPIVGAHAATVGAVILWPLALFAMALFLVARVARALGGPALAVPAAIVAGLAYPATTIFLPGRIDHHGLQVVLLLAALLGMLGDRRWHRAGAGAAAAASLAIGVETVPLLATIGLVALVDWVAGRDRDGESLAAFAVGAFGGLVAARIAFAGSAWTYPACDGFTEIAWTAAMTLAAAPVALAGSSGVVTSLRARALAAVVVAGGAAALAVARAPACLSPYGAVDPLLARLWLSHVAEAQSILTADAATAIGYGGVMVAGVAATLWQCRRGTRGWLIVAALQATALALTAVQLRGAYAGAILAAPGLAAVIVAARARGGVRLAAAWLASAGMLYPIAANALQRPPAARAVAAGDCTSRAALATLATLPTGTVLAPIDAGPQILLATRHRVVAAPYHRNGAADLAMYRFYLGTPAHAARAIAAAHADYAMACVGMPGVGTPGTTAAALAAGSPAGLAIVARASDGTLIVAPRLSKGVPAL